MSPTKIHGANVTLKAPTDWHEDADGECAELPVLMQEHGETRTFQSAWKPTAAELRALQKGHCVILTIMGRQHPPVQLVVSDRRVET